MDIAQLVANYPAVGNTEIHSSCSEKYALVNTARVVERITSEGWQIIGGKQARTLKPENRQFARHSVLLAKGQEIEALGGRSYVQLMNAHAGRGSAKFRAGIFKFACANECLSGAFLDIKIESRHIGNAEDRMVEAFYQIAQQMPALTQRVVEWTKYDISYAQAVQLAEAGLTARFGEDRAKWAIDADTVVRNVRRTEDATTDLWSVYNRVQENILRPFTKGRLNEETGRRMAFRKVSALDSVAQINTALWNTADKLVGLVS